MTSKPVYRCPSCGTLSPDLVLRDAKRPRCALCNGATVVEPQRADPRRQPPDSRLVMPQ